MRIQGLPDTCTARHFYDFPSDKKFYPAWSSARYEENVVLPLRKQIVEQLNNAKLQRIVNVFAFLIPSRQSDIAKILEEYGFTKVADYNNYKYPDTSGRLWLYSRDMNDWDAKTPVPGVHTKDENPFAVRVTPPTIPGALLAPRLTTGVLRIRGEDYHAINVRKYISLSAALAQRTTTGKFRTQRGGYVEEPFPRGVWVALPASLTRIPPTLREQDVQVLLSNGNVLDWSWSRFVGQVVAVRRM